MDVIDLTLIVIAAFVAVAVVVIVRYPRTFKASLEGLGIKFRISGTGERGTAEKTRQRPSSAPAASNTEGNVTEASGDGAVAIGGSANGAVISTSAPKARKRRPTRTGS